MSGNGTEAAAAIEALLAARDAPGETAAAVLVAMRRALADLTETALVRGDGAATAIAEELAQADDMEAFTAALERLDRRVAVLLRRRAAAGGPKPEERPRRAARTLLRL